MEGTSSGTHEVAQLLSVVQARRQYYRDILSLLPVGVAVVAGDGTIRYATPALCRQLSIPEATALNRMVGELLPSEALSRRMLAARSSGIATEPFTCQIRESAWRISIAPVDFYNKFQEIDCVLFVENPCEIHQARLEPVESNLSLTLPEDLVDRSIPAIVWQADRSDLKFQSIRGGAVEVLDFSAEHWKSTPDFFAERIHPEDRAGVLACYRTAIENGGDASAEFRGLCATGHTWLREAIRVAGSVITGVVTPVGSLKTLEDQRLRSERIRVLTRLAGSSANCLDEAVRTVRSSSFANDREECDTALDRISQITGQLGNKIPSNPPTIVNLARFLRQSSEQLATVAGSAISVDVMVGHPVLSFAEELQLNEVLAAITASICRDGLPGSKLSITCDLHTVGDRIPGATLCPGNYARVTFRHQGRGLEFELQEPLFESLLKTQNPKRATLPALAQAYAVVREWGGDIAFLSGSDDATFWLYLPHCPSFDLELEPAAVPAEAVESNERETSYRDLVDLLLAELAAENAAGSQLPDSYPQIEFETEGNILERPLL